MKEVFCIGRSSKETDSGRYINGVYTSKNGDTNSGGLNCPKGTRLYDPTMVDAVYFMPDDLGANETFEMISRNVAPDILPYYAISNYGRVLNIKTGKIMKPNYRPNGYEYLCLCADNCKHGQKKYSTHRLVLGTFDPVDNMDKLTVNHKNLNKADNYVDKIMPDGSIESNLEWATSQENAIHRDLNLQKVVKLDQDKANDIRNLYQAGYTYEQIRSMGYDYVSSTTIQNICRNKTFIDESYIPRDSTDSFETNPMNIHRLSNSDAEFIRYLYNVEKYNCKQIKEIYFPNFSESTISDIVRGITHNKDSNIV